MAFSLYITVDGTTTQLNDGQPFYLTGVEGLSSAPVIRFGQRSPLQDGSSDLGFRLSAREFRLSLVFWAADDATLDDYRDTLTNAFRPLQDVPIALYVQRDDDEIRTISCYTVAEIDIEVAPELRPGHAHRANVTLRAASPFWRATDTTSGSATFTALDTWYRAGGTITASQVAYPVTYPGKNAIYTFPGGAITGNWAVAFVTERDDTGGAGVGHYAWDADTDSGSFYRAGTSLSDFRWYNSATGTTWPGTTGFNYHVVTHIGSVPAWYYWDGSALVHHAGNTTNDFSLDDTGRWRGAGSDAELAWEPAIRKGVILRDATLNQLNALGPYILDTVNGTVTLVNEGDTNAYPIITLQGPLVDPVITNQTTGHSIDLTGGTILDGEVWTLDLRDGHKQLRDQGSINVLGSITTSPIGMADFSLAPHPTASGGTNIITLAPGSVGSAAVFSVQFTNQYLSF